MTAATEQVGEMGLSFNEVGSVVQSLARVIVDREEYTFDEVQAALRNWDGEVDLWDRLGRIVDELTEELFDGEA